MGVMGERAARLGCMLLLMMTAAAAAARQDYHPLAFDQPLKVTRGTMSPRSPYARYLSHDETCRYLVSEQGWLEGDCASVENILINPVPGIASAVIYKPVDEGYVRFDDWSQSKEAIAQIWTDLTAALKAQGERLNRTIVPEKWLVYPTLDPRKAYMDYALSIDWGGVSDVNVKASLFDRSGYVTFLILPARPDASAADIQALVTRLLAAYASDPETSYFDFKPGDKVAAIGAAGVLAALVGVKLAKVAAVGVFAVLLAAGKKLLFLLVVLPFLALKRLLGRRKSDV